MFRPSGTTIALLQQCNVCLESVEGSQLVTKLCSDTCKAQICRSCFGRHIEVTLHQFFSGVLPKIRCPTCLVAINMAQWQHQVPQDAAPALLAQYSKLCRQACGLTPPCCHYSGYTHLPALRPPCAEEQSWGLPPVETAVFCVLNEQFCQHHQPPRAVVDYALSTFGEDQTLRLLNDVLLPQIADPERRATLLLSFMYLRPKTKTRCCGAAFCYNCKGRGHHDKCKLTFNEGQDLVRCRNCHLLLLKVEGCDRVTCVCGLSMRWSDEKKAHLERTEQQPHSKKKKRRTFSCLFPWRLSHNS